MNGYPCAHRRDFVIALAASWAPPTHTGAFLSSRSTSSARNYLEMLSVTQCLHVPSFLIEWSHG